MSKNEKTTLLPSEMAERIRNLKVKSSGVSEYDTSEHSVVFYDYEGTVLYSYSSDKFLSLTEMPPNPSHDGLVAQGWNWELEDAKEYVAQHEALTIGQLYTTHDGKTRIYLRIDKTVEDHMLERNTHWSKYGWRDTEHTHQTPSYGQYHPDEDFYNFYLDLSFWYEDDGEEHDWPEFPQCAIIDWGDGSEPDSCWVSGNSGGLNFSTDAPYGENCFRYTHRYYSTNLLYTDYVITIEILDDCWRGRLSFSSNDFEDEDKYAFFYRSHWTTARVNAPQFVQKIEIGDYMDLASHPDILRDGSFYLPLLPSDAAEECKFLVTPYSGFATISFPASDLDLYTINTNGYLYVQLCLGKWDQLEASYVPFDFNVDELLIRPSVEFVDEYGFEFLSKMIDDEFVSFTAGRSVSYFANMDNAGYVRKAKTYRHLFGGTHAFVGRFFEIDDGLPQSIGIGVTYPVEEDQEDRYRYEMGLAVAWIPAGDIQYSSDNYLYNLESISLPKGLKSLGNVCFKNCYKLQHVTVPPRITELPNGTFANDYALKSVSLPKSIEKIGVQAFYGCDILNDIQIPDDVVSVGAGAFEGCGGLSTFPKYVDVSETVSYQNKNENNVVPEDIFSDCSELTELVLPGTTTKIDARAFKNCRVLENVNIPATMKEIGEEAFSGCTSLSGGEGAFFGKLGKDSSIDADRSLIWSVGKSAFKGCRSLEIILFPPRVSLIPESVCEDCQSLARIRIPINVNTISDRAFYDCKSLLNVYYTTSVYEIGDYAFSGCRFAEFEVMNPGSGSDNVLPEYLTHIGKRAFEKTSLRKVVIPYAVKEINEGVFSECKLLESVEFVRDSFQYLIYHETIFRIEKIGPYAFYSTLLTSISFPDSVTTIGEYAFADCWRLENVTLPSNLEKISDHVFESTHIKSIQLPNSITKIGDYAFHECTALETINIPANVTSIGEGAFMHCYKIPSVTFPESVTSIGDYAFSMDDYLGPYSRKLESITFKSSVPPTVEGSHAWDALPTSCVIHVPRYHLEIYKTAANYPDPNIYTYVGDQDDTFDNTALVSGSALVLSGPSVGIMDESLDFTGSFATIDNDELILTS